MSAASYLSAHGVEAAVAKAVASVCTRRPEDPIGDIGKQLIALSEKQAPPAYIGYVGCFTNVGCADPFEGSLGGVPHDRTQIGQGIRTLQISTSGALTLGGVIAAASSLSNPSYLCLTPAAAPKHLYAVCEMDEKTASVAAFAISGASAKLIGEPQLTKGGYPCMVNQAVSPVTGEAYALVCNYGGGSVTAFTINADGSLTEHQIVAHEGASVDKSRQESPHCHHVAVRGQYAYVVDLGIDAVITYKLHAEGPSGPLLTKVSRYDVTPAGYGPRSLSLHPTNEALAALSLEMAAKVRLVKLLPDGGVETVCEVDLNPPEWPKDGEVLGKYNHGKWASDVVWGKSGKFLYAASRLINNLCVFAFDETTSSLTLVQRIPSGGATPRNLCLSPDGTLLLCCNQHGHNIVSFAVESATGQLRAVDKVEVPLAACVKMFAASV